eukprot:CAMPEP_0194200936 /NCGR_PEP_ID=MMETSP0156-20130528/1359_1 /TAXON_ID=33649 /ORGANISM="Thalassionema nitzschioides, Strain L26-B" /LENGTH=235 /DNA_ID=CAMNT_0038926011 /DNA_START=26 /DNA_END=733 /DNA_ORIENTATION=-
MSSSTSSKLTLAYFPIGGKAEPIRLACAAGDIAFTNKVIPPTEFTESKSSLPLGQLPVLYIENADSKKSITQSSAILRYVGKIGGLYPKDDDVVAMKIDEILSIIDDLVSPLILTVQGAVRALVTEDKEWTYEEKIAIRKRWSEKTLPRYLGFIDQILSASTSGWLVGDSLTIADLRLYCDLNWIIGGILDGIPSGMLKEYPDCLKLMENIEAHEGVKKWTDKYSKPYTTFDYAP